MLWVARAHVGLVQRVGGVVGYAVGLLAVVGLLAGVQRGFLHETGGLEHEPGKIRVGAQGGVLRQLLHIHPCAAAHGLQEGRHRTQVALIGGAPVLLQLGICLRHRLLVRLAGALQAAAAFGGVALGQGGQRAGRHAVFISHAAQRLHQLLVPELIGCILRALHGKLLRRGRQPHRRAESLHARGILGVGVAL